MAKTYQELAVWQIADELRREIYRITEAGAAARDFRFRDQIRQAAGGVAINIAEGFRRFSAREFLQFLRYAYASAGEVAEWLEDGVARKHWTDGDVSGARRILGRLNPPLLSLIRYLRSPAAVTRSEPAKRSRRS